MLLATWTAVNSVLIAVLIWLVYALFVRETK